ncbi:hypothetical protein [Streptomyces sp. NPDC101206]
MRDMHAAPTSPGFLLFCSVLRYCSVLPGSSGCCGRGRRARGG